MNDHMKTLKYDIPLTVIMFLVSIPFIGIVLASFLEGETILLMGTVNESISDGGI